MAARSSDRTIVHLELIRREVRLALTRQPGWIAIGLSVPLAVALYTMLRRWQPELSQLRLMQGAMWFAAWNIVYSIFYVIAHWQQVKDAAVEREQLHLPVAPVHFAIRRVLLMCAVPLVVSILGLLAYLALLFYYQRPYGVEPDFNFGWRWAFDGLGGSWGAQLWWIGCAIFSGTLLVIALAAWLEYFVANRHLRSLLLLLIPTALYFFEFNLVGYDREYGTQPWHFHPLSMGGGPMLVDYHSYDVSALPFAVLGMLLIAVPLLMAWLPRRAALAVLFIPVVVVGLILTRQYLPIELRALIPDPLRAALRPTVAKLHEEPRYAAALLLGHLDPPENVRLLLITFPSDLFFDTKWFQLRVGMWFTAGLYPLVLPLWLIATLLLGTHWRGDSARA